MELALASFRSVETFWNGVCLVVTSLHIVLHQTTPVRQQKDQENDGPDRLGDWSKDERALGRLRRVNRARLVVDRTQR